MNIKAIHNSRYYRRGFQSRLQIPAELADCLQWVFVIHGSVPTSRSLS